MLRERRDWIASCWLAALVVAGVWGVFFFDVQALGYVGLMVFLTFMAFHTAAQADQGD